MQEMLTFTIEFLYFKFIRFPLIGKEFKRHIDHKKIDIAMQKEFDLYSTFFL